jgi:hypothetical protein
MRHPLGSAFAPARAGGALAIDASTASNLDFFARNLAARPVTRFISGQNSRVNDRNVEYQG